MRYAFEWVLVQFEFSVMEHYIELLGEHSAGFGEWGELGDIVEVVVIIVTIIVIVTVGLGLGWE